MRCKACHCQFLSILAEKQPRVALCAWIVSIAGFSNSLRIAGIGFARLGEDRVRHHPILVEAAQRQDPRFEHRRDLVDKFGGSLDTFGDEDRVARPIGIGDVVADVVEQQHALANVAVGQADPARESSASSVTVIRTTAALGELLVGKSERAAGRARDRAR